MVQSLMIVSDNPRTIWDEINAIQEGFFIPVVKEEYGMNDDANKKQIVSFEEELAKHKKAVDTKIIDIVKDYQSQLRMLSEQKQQA